MNESEKKKRNPLSVENTVDFYIDKRKPVYILCIVLAALSLFFAWNTEITDSLVAYMPSYTNSGAGFDIMEEEFTDLATATVVLENVSFDQCELMHETLSNVEGVYSVDFNEKNYEDGVGAFAVTFAYEEGEEARASLEALKETVSLFDGGVSSSMDSGWWWNVDFSLIFLLFASTVILIIALVYASRTYADVWVMLITVGFGVILNYGTSFGMSKVTNLSCFILQAAITMYYTALVCRRYTKERKTQEVKPAIIAAVSANMPKILGGGVIAVVALLALAVSRLQIGFNFALSMTKGILIAMILCETLLPGLIMTFAGRMDKSRHKNLLPKIKKRGSFTFKTKYVFPIIFVVFAIAALTFTIVYPVAPYAYGGDHLTALVRSPGQQREYIAETDLSEGTSTVYMLIPANDDEAERAVVKELQSNVNVVSVTALSNSTAATYVLTDEISIWQFADITGLEESAVWNIYSSYGEMVGVETAGGVGEYEIPFIDVFMYTYGRVQDGSLTVSSQVSETLDSVYHELYGAELQLSGESYDRVIIEVCIPEDPDKAESLIEDLSELGQKHYEGEVYLTGDNGAIADLSDAYLFDTILVTALTVVLLIVVLAVMFKAPGLATILVLMVQGGVWLSMAVPYIFPGEFIHISSMLGYTVQMLVGVTYAAALTSSYIKFKKNNPLKNAMGKAMKGNYSLIVITGCLLILSGAILGLLSFDAATMAFGFTIAIGGAINMLLALCVIPQTLLLWDIIVSKANGTKLVLTKEKKAPVEERMDIVEAIEKLKADELADTQVIEIPVGEKEAEQIDEAEK